MMERDAFVHNALLAELDRHVLVLKGEKTLARPARTGGADGRALDQLTPAEILQDTFGLSDFELDVLLLCAVIEFDGACAAALTEHHSAEQPSFSVAMAALPGSHWSALLPEAPLRKWRLIEIGSGTTLVGSALRIDERILHFLVGLETFDQRLTGLASLTGQDTELAPGHLAVAHAGAACWRIAIDGSDAMPVLQYNGDDPEIVRAIATRTAGELGMQLLALSIGDLPPEIEAADRLLILAEREALLNQASLLLVDSASPERSPGQREATARRLIERAQIPTMLSAPDLLPGGQREVRNFEVRPVTPEERVFLWRQLIGNERVSRDDLERIAYQFDLGLAEMRAAAAEASDRHVPGGAGPLAGKALWDACRHRSRGASGGLLERIEPRASWDALVLPPREKATLRHLVDQLQYRHKVLGDWGFGQQGGRGLGMTALFAGPSGTGKTFAAEVLAHELKLDLYRIDLSTIVSKYIGETEKNLQQAFAVAEAGGAILLFDEADALFGKRSEVKDSHDRHANIEVSYLLQRIEAYSGLAILTSNLKENIDQAFLRRLRYVVSFPFPDYAHRIAIWKAVFPPELSHRQLDFAALARLNIAGGAIRSIALNAAYLAAGRGAELTMDDLAAAARSEYAKFDRTLSDAEAGDWA